MMRKDVRVLSLLTLKNVAAAPWYWLANIFGIGLIIGYQKAINLFKANGTFENNMYILEALSVFTMFVFYMLHIYSISKSVGEEKERKMNEGIYYRFSPTEFIRAKVIGYMLGAMVQLLLFSVTLILSKQLMDKNVNVIDYKRIIFVTSTILLGLMLYLFLFSALAIHESRNNPTYQLMYTGVMLVIISFLAPLGLLKSSDQSVLKVLTVIPFFSQCIAIVCMFKESTLITSYAELLFFIVLMVIQAVVITRICVKAYEKGIKTG